MFCYLWAQNYNYFAYATNGGLELSQEDAKEILKEKSCWKKLQGNWVTEQPFFLKQSKARCFQKHRAFIETLNAFR
jgi:hypothetical protein